VSTALDRLPLRVRLVAAVVLLVLVGLCVAGVAATSALRSDQLDRVDEQLRESVARPGGPGPGPREERPRPRGRLPGERFVALLDSSGAVVRGDEVTPGGPDLTGLDVGRVREQGRRPFTVDATDGPGSWRVVAVPVGAGEGSVVVAADLREVQRTVRRLVLLQTLIGLAVLLGVSGLGYVVVRSSLRPLVEVEEAASAVAAGDLSRRVPERDPRSEVGSLGASFNRMVDQVQSAFATRAASEDRLRRFVADASHELRTPLTSIRGFAELHRQGAVTDPAEVTRLLGRIEEEAVRMGLLVEDLLALARLDQQRPLQPTDVDLAALAADAVHDARGLDPARPVSLEVEGGLPAVRADQERLRQVLANLLANAVQHTPAGTPVQVRLRAEGRHAVVEVADEGPGMTPDVAGRAFERFYRADPSRTRASGGSGLGLSIVASLVESHGGRVELDTAPGRGSVFRVLLPLRDAAA
jgi:two-component system OmpR family sensor kinase